MNRYELFTHILKKRGKIFLGLTALLMLTSLAGILQVRIETDYSVFMPAQSVYQETAAEMEKLFGENGQMLLLLETDKSLESLKAVWTISRKIAGIPGVQTIQFPFPDKIMEGEQESLNDFIQLFNAQGELFSPREEGNSWINVRVALSDDADFPEIIKQSEEILNGSEMDYLLSGEPYLEGKIFSYILKVLLILPPIAIILLILVFKTRIGSLRATFLSMIPAIIGGVLTLGTMSWLLGEITIMSALVPIFIIVLGSADGLHVTSHVMDRLKEGKKLEQAVSHTLEAVGVPIIMTSVTTMAGFLSMLLIDSTAIKQMGAGAALGILLAGAATWLVLPVLLLHQKPLPVSPKEGENNRVLLFFKKIQGRPSLFITLLIIGVSVPGLLKLHSDFSMLSVYKKSTEVRQSIDAVSKAMGGSLPVMLIYKAESPLDMKAGNAVLSFSKEAEKRNITSKSLSLYRTVKNILNTTGMAGEIPESEAMQRSIVGMIEENHSGILDNFYSSEGYGRAFFFLPDLNDSTLGSFLELTDEISKKYDVELKPVGSAFSMKEMNDKIIPEQVKSLILAVILVILLSSLTQRSLKLGLLSGVPITITLLSLFGFMGYTGIELSVVSGIMMGITVGVGIDYAIHFVGLYSYERDRKNPEPVKTALNYVATPILANAMGLSIGFTAMALSPFRIHVTLSLLMWTTMVLSAFLSLSLLPTLLSAGRKK